jgi:hypothetical protein
MLTPPQKKKKKNVDSTKMLTPQKMRGGSYVTQFLFYRFQLFYRRGVGTPKINPLGLRKLRDSERKKERENNTVDSGPYVCHAARLQRRTGSTRTFPGPIYFWKLMLCLTF